MAGLYHADLSFGNLVGRFLGMEKVCAPTRFRGLDGLRGICALTVVLMHSELLFNAGVVFCHGYLAVDMFFILSGFVIALNYETALQKGLNLKPFLAARGRRNPPQSWICWP